MNLYALGNLMRTKPPFQYIERLKSRHGRTYYYFRKSKDSPRIRLPDPVNERNPSAEFVAAYIVARADPQALEEVNRRQSKPGSIYVIGDKDVVKIGFSTNVPQRLRTLQSGTDRKLMIIFTKAGTIQDERVLHNIFRKDRLNNEWFKRSQAIGEWLHREMCR